MADNVDLTIGDGTIIAGADDIGGVKYPRIKSGWGVNNVRVDTSLDDPLPIQPGTGVKFNIGTVSGAVLLAAGAAAIGSLINSTATIGVVKLGAGTAAVGSLTNTTATIGVVKLGAGSAAIGSLTNSTATIGFVKNSTATTGATTAPSITVTTATEKQLIAAVSAVFWDLYGLIVTNTATTPTWLFLRDILTSGVKRYVMAPARDTRGFSFNPPIQQGTSNKAWSVTATGGGVTSLQITGLAVKRK